ncbi:hypothetical protein acdb102_02080 [Acidothermaceae bacterium B102]|nr:hypothetical protein acdb102_02080 [Acidothermaceae bacterium B102]
MHGTGVVGLLAALLLAGCTLPTHHAARVTSPPPTLATITSAPVLPTLVPSPVDLQPQPISYVGLATFSHGPAVTMAVQRKKYVLLPGARQLRLDIATASAPCDTTLAASPTGHWLALTTSKGDLQVIDLRGGNQYSLGAGCDPVWGGDGRLAYLVHGPVDPAGSYSSAIVVRSSPLSGGKVWAKGMLAPQGWAAGRLVYTSVDGKGRRTPVIASRPGASHPVPVLRGHAAATGRFIAASPDGRRLLLQLDALDHAGRPLATLTLVDTATLRVVSSVVPQGFLGLTNAVWTGDRIVASNGTEPGASPHSGLGLIRFSTYGDSLRIQQVAVSSTHFGTSSDYIADLHDNGDGTVTAVHHWAGGGLLLRCRIATLKCTDTLSLGSR